MLIRAECEVDVTGDAEYMRRGTEFLETLTGVIESPELIEHARKRLAEIHAETVRYSTRIVLRNEYGELLTGAG
jgi:hypothetical protein